MPRLVSCKEGLVLQREAERRRLPRRELSTLEVVWSALLCTWQSWYQTSKLHKSSLAGCQSPDTPPNCDAGAGKIWKSLGQNCTDFCSGAERHFGKISHYLLVWDSTQCVFALRKVFISGHWTWEVQLWICTVVCCTWKKSTVALLESLWKAQMAGGAVSVHKPFSCHAGLCFGLLPLLSIKRHETSHGPINKPNGCVWKWWISENGNSTGNHDGKPLVFWIFRYPGSPLTHPLTVQACQIGALAGHLPRSLGVMAAVQPIGTQETHMTHDVRRGFSRLYGNIYIYIEHKKWPTDTVFIAIEQFKPSLWFLDFLVSVQTW